MSGLQEPKEGTTRDKRMFQQRNYGLEALRMRGILLWALGIPIPVIILLYLFHVI
jgi:hypothetical protein